MPRRFYDSESNRIISGPQINIYKRPLTASAAVFMKKSGNQSPVFQLYFLKFNFSHVCHSPFISFLFFFRDILPFYYTHAKLPKNEHHSPMEL